MKIISKILSVALVLSGIMPLMAVVFSYTDQQKVMELFQLNTAPTPELQIVIVMMGAALIFASVIQFIAAVWVWNGREAGLSLSVWVGIMLLAAGVYMIAGLSKLGVADSKFYIVDLVKGVIILGLTIAARKKA